MSAGKIFIEKSHAVISDALFMTIGDKAVTQSDIVAEIKTLLILNYILGN